MGWNSYRTPGISSSSVASMTNVRSHTMLRQHVLARCRIARMAIDYETSQVRSSNPVPTYHVHGMVRPMYATCLWHYIIM